MFIKQMYNSPYVHDLFYQIVEKLGDKKPSSITQTPAILMLSDPSHPRLGYMQCVAWLEDRKIQDQLAKKQASISHSTEFQMLPAPTQRGNLPASQSISRGGVQVSNTTYQPMLGHSSPSVQPSFTGQDPRFNTNLAPKEVGVVNDGTDSAKIMMTAPTSEVDQRAPLFEYETLTDSLSDDYSFVFNNVTKDTIQSASDAPLKVGKDWMHVAKDTSGFFRLPDKAPDETKDGIANALAEKYGNVAPQQAGSYYTPAASTQPMDRSQQRQNEQNAAFEQYMAKRDEGIPKGPQVVQGIQPQHTQSSLNPMMRPQLRPQMPQQRPQIPQPQPNPMFQMTPPPMAPQPMQLRPQIRPLQQQPRQFQAQQYLPANSMNPMNQIRPPPLPRQFQYTNPHAFAPTPASVRMM